MAKWIDEQNDWSQWDKADQEAAVEYFVRNKIDPASGEVPPGAEEDKERARAYWIALDSAFQKYNLDKANVTIQQVEDASRADSPALKGQYARVIIDYLTNIKPKLTATKTTNPPKRDDAATNVTSTSPPKNSLPPQAKADFLETWDAVLIPDLKDRFAPEFKDDTNANKGFSIKSKPAPADNPTGKSLIEITPESHCQAFIREGNWATEEEKIQLLIAGFKANNLNKKEELNVKGGSPEFRKKLRQALQAEGFRVKPEIPSARDSFRQKTLSEEPLRAPARRLRV